MKADRNGTWTEQVRANMGWKSPAQAKAEGGRTFCENCKFHWLKESPNRDGGASGNYSSYCGHPRAAGDKGHATRQGARCNHWEMKP